MNTIIHRGKYLVAFIALMLCPIAAQAAAMLTDDAPSVTIHVNSEDGSERLAGIPVTIVDNYPLTEMAKRQNGVTDDDGTVVFNASALNGFTVAQDVFNTTTYDVADPEKQYPDGAAFKLRLIVGNAENIDQRHELTVPVHESIAYDVDYQMPAETEAAE